MWSVILSDIPRVALFLEHGASIDAVDFAGNGLLHWATATAAIDHTPQHRERAERMIAWLIDHGANEQRTNKLGLMARAYFDSLR
jgi:ankyrin repeat protein